VRCHCTYRVCNDPRKNRDFLCFFSKPLFHHPLTLHKRVTGYSRSHPCVLTLYPANPPRSGSKHSATPNHTVYYRPPCNSPAKISFQSYLMGLARDLGGMGIPISSITSSAILSISVNDGLASCNCPLNGLYVLKPHGRSFSLRRAFRSWEYVRRATSENAQSTNLAIISSSVVCTSKRAKNSLGIRIDGMSCLHKGNKCCSLIILL